MARGWSGASHAGPTLSFCGGSIRLDTHKINYFCSHRESNESIRPEKLDSRFLAAVTFSAVSVRVNRAFPSGGRPAPLRLPEALSDCMRTNFRGLPFERIEMDEQWQYVAIPRAADGNERIRERRLLAVGGNRRGHEDCFFLKDRAPRWNSGKDFVADVASLIRVRGG